MIPKEVLDEMKKAHRQNDERMPPLPMESQKALARAILNASPDDPHARINMGDFDFIEAGDLRIALQKFITE